MDPSHFGAGDVNFYRAEGNHPASAVDPSGLQTARGPSLPDGEDDLLAPPPGTEGASSGLRGFLRGLDEALGTARVGRWLDARAWDLFDWLAKKSMNEKGEVVGVGQPGTAESFIPVWGNGRAAFDHAQNGRWGWAALYTAMMVSDFFLVGSIGKLAWKGAVLAGTKIAARVAAKEAAKDAAPKIASSGVGIAEAEGVRFIRPGERIRDLIRELAERTYASGGKEHAIISLRDGTRVIVKGGTGGINFAPFSQNLRRVILHTHPTPTGGPSAFDFNMLNQMGQRSSWIYELFGGGLTKFSVP